MNALLTIFFLLAWFLEISYAAFGETECTAESFEGTWKAETLTCFKYIEEPTTTWVANTCKETAPTDSNGRLAQVPSAAILNFLVDTSTADFWIGLRADLNYVEGGHYSYRDGDGLYQCPVIYYPSEGLEKGSGTDRDCVRIQRSTKKWKEDYCSNTTYSYSYWCEYIPTSATPVGEGKGGAGSVCTGEESASVTNSVSITVTAVMFISAYISL